MQNTIRLALVVVMAVISARVFADEEATVATTKAEVDAPKSEINATSGDVRAAYDALGSGSGEPGRSDTRLQKDAPADKNAAIREFNRQEFLREVWALPLIRRPQLVTGNRVALASFADGLRASTRFPLGYRIAGGCPCARVQTQTPGRWGERANATLSSMSGRPIPPPRTNLGDQPAVAR
jgi:hypothetical protein